MMQQTVNIATASSDEYVPFLCVLLRSILDHVAHQYDYHIIVISDGISVPHKKSIERMATQKKNVSIQFVEVVGYLTDPDLYTRGHITRATYSRLYLLDLPDHIERIIYTDADLVFNIDPAELYFQDLQSNCLAAVRDPMMTSWCIGKRKEPELQNLSSLGITDCRNYFNAGVMLIDLALCRKLYETEQLYKLAASREWLWFDQDVLNKEFQDRVLYLDQTWNFMTCTEAEHHALLNEILGYPYQKHYMPNIVHYAGRTIPCFRPRIMKGSYFWKYAARTPFFYKIVWMLFLHLLKKCISIFKNSSADFSVFL